MKIINSLVLMIADLFWTDAWWKKCFKSQIHSLKSRDWIQHKLLTTSLIPEIPLRPQNHQHLGFTKARFTLVISGVSYPDTVQVRLTHSWYQTSLRSDHVSLESVLVLWRHVDPV